jgi:hypothetical protein
MKKMLIILIAGMFTAVAVNAQTDSTKNIDYYFYPEANVYYNPQTKTYSWFDQSRASWTTGIQLPLAFKIKDENKFNTIKYPGTDIWVANPDHIKIYGNQVNPVMPKTNNAAPEKPVPPPQK